MSDTSSPIHSCDYCHKVIADHEKAYSCVCAKYGSSHEGHYCSPECMDNSHPDYDVDVDE